MAISLITTDHDFDCGVTVTAFIGDCPPRVSHAKMDSRIIFFMLVAMLIMMVFTTKTLTDLQEQASPVLEVATLRNYYQATHASNISIGLAWGHKYPHGRE